MSPKSGANTAKEAVWVKTVPRAIADGLTGGRSVGCGLVSRLMDATAAAMQGDKKWSTESREKQAKLTIQGSHGCSGEMVDTGTVFCEEQDRKMIKFDGSAGRISSVGQKRWRFWRGFARWRNDLNFARDESWCLGILIWSTGLGRR